MDSLSAWLTGTVPGVVLLGAAGSLLAVLILEKTRIVARTWIPRIEQWTGSALFWWLDQSLEDLVRLRLTHDYYPVFAMLAYELGKLILLSAGALFFLFWAVLGFASHRTSEPPLNAVLMFAFFFLCVYGATKSIARLWLHRIFTMRGGLYDSTLKAHVEKKPDASATPAEG
jgi:hypothetical protein